MNKDLYSEIINGKDTFETISYDLINHGSCIIGWTDEGCDHRDIMFTYKPNKYGSLQRGFRWCSFYVSIMDYSSYGFLIESDMDNRKSEDYIMEKLRLHDNSCDLKICDLINGVIHELDKKEGNI